MSGPDSLYDTSVWIAQTFRAHPLHAIAQSQFAIASPTRRAMFCRATQQSVLRLLSSPNIAAQYGVPPINNADALLILDVFMANPAVGYIDEPAGVEAQWRAFGGLSSASPKRWMDAYLGAFAIRANLQFVTCDAAFTTFAGLNPTVLALQKTVAPSPPAKPGAGTNP